MTKTVIISDDDHALIVAKQREIYKKYRVSLRIVDITSAMIRYSIDKIEELFSLGEYGVPKFSKVEEKIKNASDGGPKIGKIGVIEAEKLKNSLDNGGATLDNGEATLDNGGVMSDDGASIQETGKIKNLSDDEQKINIIQDTEIKT